MRVVYACILMLGLLFALPGLSLAANNKILYAPVKTVPTDMELIEVGKVKDVLKANSIQLENGSVFILDNIRTPIYYERLARDFLTELVKGKTVGLYRNKTLPEEGRADAHGNEIVHAVIDDGTWVEQEIVSHGLAWVDSSVSNRDCVETLYKYEIPARAKHLGFWASPQFKVRNPDNMKGTIGTFQVFEGVPTTHTHDWDWDSFGFYSQKNVSNARLMTVYLKRTDYPNFPNLAADPTRHAFSGADLFGPRMRIRGWVETPPNGAFAGTPMITLTHPEQLEFPDGPPIIK